MLSLVLLLTVADTVPLRVLAHAPVFDGVIGTDEYGPPILQMQTQRGSVPVWMGRSGDWVYVAAALPDSTAAWRDEFALLLDPVGDRSPAPGHDDSQWVIRRVLDSSEVLRGVHGRWQLPGDDPAWRLGPARGGEGWDVMEGSGLAVRIWHDACPRSMLTGSMDRMTCHGLADPEPVSKSRGRICDGFYRLYGTLHSA